MTPNCHTFHSDATHSTCDFLLTSYIAERERKKGAYLLMCPHIWQTLWQSKSFCLCISWVQNCVKVGGKYDLHCGGPGENVNTGCQPPLHDCPGKKDRRVGSVDRKERKEKLNTQTQHETQRFIMVLFKQAARMDLHALHSEKMVNFAFCYIIVYYQLTCACPPPLTTVSEGGDLHIWPLRFFLS